MKRNYIVVLIILSFMIGMLAPVQGHAAESGKEYGGRFPIEELVMFNASQEDIDFIGSLKGLRKLEISIWDEKTVDLTPLTNLQELQELGISVKGIWDAKTDMSQLGELKQLKKLSISECSSDLSFIHEMKNLQELTIWNSSIDNLSFLKGLTELRYLRLKYVSDSDLAYLEGMTKMNEISIQGCHMRNFECLGDMKYLTSVYLSDTEINKDEVHDIDLNVFAEADSLSSLFLEGMRITEAEPISRLPELEEIIFSATGVKDIESLENLKNLKTLKIFGYGSPKVVGQALAISGLKTLVLMD